MEKVVKKSVKSRIVTAAWQLFYEKGYNGTTVDDIIGYLQRFFLLLFQHEG